MGPGGWKIWLVGTCKRLIPAGPGDEISGQARAQVGFWHLGYSGFRCSAWGVGCEVSEEAVWGEVRGEWRATRGARSGLGEPALPLALP